MYHTIVIGLGSMGSSALFQLAKRGVKVLGLEQFGIVHEKGSHSGQTRIVRKAYFEHPDYVPLLEASYKGWKSLEELRGEQLFHQVGLAYYGSPDHPVMAGVKQSAEQYDINIHYSTRNIQHSMFQLPAGFEGLLEPEAGFALVEPTIRAYTEEAVKLGAEVQTGETVMGIRVHKDFVEIHTDKMQYQAQKVVIAAGVYAERLLPSLTDTLTVSRQLIHWIRPDNPESFSYDNFLAWVLAGEEFPGIYYGFPVLDPERFGGNGLLKVAHHYPGMTIDPEELNDFDPEDSVKATEKVLRNYLPEALGEIVETSVCMYTNTPDEHFIIDFLPESEEKIIVATGFSGHGFKFVPVIGEVLADLSAEGTTDHPVGFLNLSRFSK